MKADPRNRAAVITSQILCAAGGQKLVKILAQEGDDKKKRCCAGSLGGRGEGGRRGEGAAGAGGPVARIVCVGVTLKPHSSEQGKRTPVGCLANSQARPKSTKLKHDPGNQTGNASFEISNWHRQLSKRDE